jgi:hypothetical protein
MPNPSETSIAVPSGAAINVDVVTVVSPNVLVGTAPQTVARQVMVEGDPQDAFALAAVKRAAPTGDEYARIVKLSPGSSELQEMNLRLAQILTELQNLVTVLSGFPATPPVPFQ